MYIIVMKKESQFFKLGWTKSYCEEVALLMLKELAKEIEKYYQTASKWIHPHYFANNMITCFLVCGDMNEYTAQEIRKMEEWQNILN